MGLSLSFLIPDENATPEKLQSWRWKMAGSNMLLWVVVSFLFAVMFTGVIRVGQVAWASDIVTKADKAEIDSIKTEQLAQRTILTDVQKAIEEQRKEAKAAEIRKLALKRCQTDNSEEKESYTREIDRLQAEYKKINNDEPYERPRCSEL